MCESKAKNDDPLYYCKICLSLAIKKLEDTNLSYCKDCGNTEIIVSFIPIKEYEEIYKSRYGKYFITRNRKLEKEE